MRHRVNCSTRTTTGFKPDLREPNPLSAGCRFLRYLHRDMCVCQAGGCTRARGREAVPAPKVAGDIVYIQKIGRIPSSLSFFQSEVGVASLATVDGRGNNSIRGPGPWTSGALTAGSPEMHSRSIQGESFRSTTTAWSSSFLSNGRTSCNLSDGHGK